ncbi:MAG: hypothetical protein R3247_06245 [Rhodothermales bacterium]|nr:hypothetical protein [Rhodothermales bacterium]
MNIPYLLAGLVAVGAVSLHVYTFEVWIWPKLRDEGFPAVPFGPPSVTKGFYRTVWHFFTISWLGTIFLMFAFAFTGFLAADATLVVRILIVYWLLIVVEIFVVAALSRKPGENYVRTMIKAFQWVIVLVMVACMWWGLP